MAHVPRTERERLDDERGRDRVARREAAKKNAARGVGQNLEEAIRLLSSADEFRVAFERKR